VPRDQLRDGITSDGLRVLASVRGLSLVPPLAATPAGPGSSLGAAAVTSSLVLGLTSRRTSALVSALASARTSGLTFGLALATRDLT
jgi:hypothetical protein